MTKDNQNINQLITQRFERLNKMLETTLLNHKRYIGKVNKRLIKQSNKKNSN